MPRYLSDEWFERRRQLVDASTSGAAEAGDGVPVQHVVTGGPDGDVTYHARSVGGLLVDAEPGADAAASLTLTSTYAVGVALATAELEPAVAFMQGRLKAEGDMPALYALLAAARRDDVAAATTAVAAETEA